MIILIYDEKTKEKKEVFLFKAYERYENMYEKNFLMFGKTIDETEDFGLNEVFIKEIKEKNLSLNNKTCIGKLIFDSIEKL